MVRPAGRGRSDVRLPDTGAVRIELKHKEGAAVAALLPYKQKRMGCELVRNFSSSAEQTTSSTRHEQDQIQEVAEVRFDDADANDLFALQSNAYVLRSWDAPPWSERARSERFITACRQMAEEGTGARLAVDRVSDEAFIGWCSLNRWNPDYRSASLGYCFGDAAWGHGYATEAARALLRWAFDTLDLNRVQAEADTRNVASARVLEKLVFAREGTLREDCVVNGEVSDSWVYGLIRREWRPSSEPVPAR
jgi:RimJ/RimL family protein N-acetyltransferase